MRWPGSQLARRDAQIRLEKRVADNPRIELDLLVVVGDHRMAFELKYQAEAGRPGRR